MANHVTNSVMVIILNTLARLATASPAPELAAQSARSAWRDRWWSAEVVAAAAAADCAEKRDVEPEWPTGVADERSFAEAVVAN